LSLKKSIRVSFFYSGDFSTQRCILLQYYQQSRQKVQKGACLSFFSPPFVLILLKNEKKGQLTVESSSKSLDLWHLHHRFYSFVQKIYLGLLHHYITAVARPRNRCKCFLPLKCLLLYWIYTTSVLSGYQYFMAMYLACLLAFL